MKRIHIVLAILLLSSTVSLAKYHTIAPASSDSFVLKGNIQNFKESFFEFGITGFFDSPTMSVIVDKKGNFSHCFKTEGIQDIYLYLNDDAIKFFVQPGDTLSLTWDQKDFKNTFKISSPLAYRNIEIEIMLVLNDKSKSFRELNIGVRKKGLADSVKYRMINDSYNAYMTLLDQSISKTPPNSYKIAYDIYYSHTKLLRDINLLNAFHLKLNKPFVHANFELETKARLNFEDMFEEVFKCSEEYRDFIYDHVRFYKPFKGWSSTRKENIIPFNPARTDYMLGEGFINLQNIKDWFQAKAIMSAFEHYRFEDVKDVYDLYLKEGKTTEYLDIVKSFYTKFSRLAPGLPAPEFSLRDVNGRSVSLDNFKGKLVYIDFWGVYCGPCRSDIERYSAKIHEKYKDSVVFINICVDANEGEWKSAIKELKLDGINLIAEGWTNNQVCQDYNIKGIPHYMLIDEEGRFIDNNGPNIYQLVNDQNALDKLLIKNIGK